jgi:hypothetical protein
MRRQLIAAATAAMLGSLAVHAINQSPAAQQPPVATSPATPATPNAAPTIALSTDPVKQVFGTGERLIVVANASDDADSAERLLYQWTVRNLDTGVEQPARSTALRQVRTRLTTPGKYEYKCVVTDTGGLFAEATLVVTIEDAGTAEVVGLAFDDSTAALHHVLPYWREGFPAIRRGDWVTILVSVRNFIAGAHHLRVFVDGKADDPTGPSSRWAVQNLGGSTTERTLRLFVPSDAGVGKHSIEVAVFKRGEATETGRIAFSPEPLVLFNPWRSLVPDVSVQATNPLPNDSATLYARGTQDLAIGGQASETVYDTTPYDVRGDASRVAAAMAAHPGKDAEPHSLTALLRSVGIPTRRVTTIGAGRDIEPPLGMLQTKYTCRTWSASRCEGPKTESAQEQVHSEMWNEVWIPGKDISGWIAADATPRTNLPWEIWWQAQDNKWYQASGADMALHRFASNARLERSDEGRTSATTPAAPATPALQITAGPLVNLRSATAVRISASGLGAAPTKFGLAVLHLPRELNGGALESPVPAGLAFATVLDVRPAAGTWTGTVELPRDVFAMAGAYEVVVGPPQGAAGPSGRARVDVRGVPIAVALPPKVDAGATFAVSAQFVNSSDVPVRNAELRLNLPSQFRVVGGTESAEQDMVSPGGNFRLSAMVQALSSGKFLAGASSDSSAGFSEAYAPVAVMQGGRVFLDAVPSLGVTVGSTVTVTANVMLESVEPAGEAEAELRPVGGAAISLLSDARKTTSALGPDDRWTPSWQILVNAPGTYRLPVRAGVAGVGEAVGEILLVAGAGDPDEDAADDFEPEGSLGYRSPKAIAGAAAVGLLAVLAVIAMVRRRRTRKIQGRNWRG